MDKEFISPEHVSALESAFAGGALSLLANGKLTWPKTLFIFISGEVCAFYCTAPLAKEFGWNAGVIGLTIGFAAMYICGAAINALTAFRDDPWKFLRAVPALQAFIGKKPDDKADV